MNDEKRLLIMRLFQIPGMDCYDYEEKYKEAEKLIDNFIKSDREARSEYNRKLAEIFAGIVKIVNLEDGKP